MRFMRLTFANGNEMSKVSKLGLVLGGYVAALLTAFAASYVLAWMRKSQDASGGMQAFGDLLGFLGIFAALALAPTALGLYFLRPVEKFWNLFSIASLALAAMGVVAAILIGSPHLSPSVMLAVGFFGLLLVLGAPLLGVGLHHAHVPAGFFWHRQASNSVLALTLSSPSLSWAIGSGSTKTFSLQLLRNQYFMGWVSSFRGVPRLAASFPSRIHLSAFPLFLPPHGRMLSFRSNTS
jgi:hypothetical protein